MIRNQICFIVENAYKVSKGSIIGINGNLYTIKLDKGTVMRLPRHRLFTDKESAAKTIPEGEPLKKNANQSIFLH